MSTYNNYRFTPGNKGNNRLFLNKQLIIQYYDLLNSEKQYESNIVKTIIKSSLCNCLQSQENSHKQDYDSSQSINSRISQTLTTTLGGKLTYGNKNGVINVNYLGGYEGQPGGLQPPLRNKF